MQTDNIHGELSAGSTLRGSLNNNTARMSGALHEGFGGTSDYNELENKPSINGVTLEGDVSGFDIGIYPIVNFSTSPQCTFKRWIDGNVIWVRTFDLSSRVISDNAWTNNLLGTSGIYIINAIGFFGLQGYGSANFPYSYYRNSGEFFTWNMTADHSDISVRPNMNAGASVTAGIITIWYTMI